MTTNLAPLADKKYSGRGITVFMTPAGVYGIGYTLTGRSPSSQARVLVSGANTQVIRTEVTDPKELEKGSPALLLYPAIVPFNGGIAASNGAQTELLYREARIREGTRHNHCSDIIQGAMSTPEWRYDHHADRWIDITTYEPDTPNNTPRISAVLQGQNAAIHIVFEKNGGKRTAMYTLRLSPGIGDLLTTYSGENESPLAPFQGDPIKVSIGEESVEELAERFFAAIQHGANPGENFGVAAAVVLRHSDGRIEHAVRNAEKDTPESPGHF